MVDPITATITAAGAKLVWDIFKDTLKGMISFDEWMRKKTSGVDPINLVAKKYAKRMQERYGAMRIIGKPEQVSLTDLYVDVNILKSISALRHISREKLEETLDRDKRGFGEVREKQPGIEVVKREPKLIVLGKPGAGKTTFLRSLIFHTFKGELGEPRIPIFINLHEWSKSKQSLFDCIVEEFGICGLPEAKAYVKKILKKGKCLLLLDGFDEVSGDEFEAVQQIKKFSDKYSDNRYVLSCRVAAWKSGLDAFTEVETADFGDSQIESFVQKFFNHDEEKAKLCWGKLKDNPPIIELAHVPLLLAMLCLTYDETMDFPAKRSVLYKDALDILLKKWDPYRRIGPDDRYVRKIEIYRKLEVPDKENLLSRMAAQTFEKERYFVDREEFETIISDYIRNIPNIEEKSLQPDSEAVLKAIEAQHGLVVERAKRVYSFSHLTFQEYFTARYIVSRPKAIKQLIEEHLFDERWREVFLLTAGMMEEADDFLLSIRRKLSQASDDKLASFFNRAEECIKETSPYPRNLSKALSFYSILSYALVSNHSLQDWHPRVLELIRTICVVLDIAVGYKLRHNHKRVLDGTLNKNRTRALDTALSIHVKKVFDSVRDDAIASEIVSQKEIQTKINDHFIKSLKDYLYCTFLFIDCLNTGAYVQKETREKLLESVLVEPWEG